MKSFIIKIKHFFSKPSIEEVAAYQHKLPTSVQVSHSFDKRTGFYTARVTQVDGQKVRGLIVTESKSADKLIGQVNDAILTYLDFPDYMKLDMPQLLPADVNFSSKITKKGNIVLAK